MRVLAKNEVPAPAFAYPRKFVLKNEEVWYDIHITTIYRHVHCIWPLDIGVKSDRKKYFIVAGVSVSMKSSTLRYHTSFLLRTKME